MHAIGNAGAVTNVKGSGGATDQIRHCDEIFGRHKKVNRRIL